MIYKLKPIIICLTETHITNNIELSEITIEGYRAEICYTHSVHTGGVIFYLKNEVKHELLKKFSVDKNMWCIVIKCKIQIKSYILIGIYHSPSASTAEFLNSLESEIEECSSNTIDTIIIGDFNIDMSSNTFYQKRLSQIITENGLKQLINEATRITNNSATLIDLLITNCEDIAFKVNHSPKITDHAFLTINLQIPDRGHDKTTRLIRSFKNYDETIFQRQLINTNWNNSITDVNILAKNLINTIIGCLDTICPITEIVLPTKYADNKWITEDILRVMRERDNAYEAARIENSNDNWNVYKEKRNKVTSMIRKQKQNYYEQKIDNCKNDSKLMWKTLKQITKEKNQSTPKYIKFNNEEIYNESDIAENFNVYFIESISDIIQNIQKYNEYEMKDIGGENKLYEFKQIEMSQLRQIVTGLPNKMGSDGISAQIIKTSFQAIGNRFLNVINSSLQTGVFPTIWKSSVVTPVPKIINTVLSEQHRPINSLPICEKILELVVKEQLTCHCEANNILIPMQSGFREAHSCESALQCIIGDWMNEIDYDNIIVAVFLDFKRAFETIDRCLLLSKLKNIGICGKALQWFTSYLSDRCQKTKVGTNVSSEKETIYGVPQGSVLGPVLFIIFINDIIESVTNCKIHLFADDTMLYISGKNINELVNRMNDDLKNVYMWLCDNNLKVNIDKCKWMVIGKKYKLNDIIDNNIIKINNETIEKVSEIKYLGVILDEQLRFKSNVDYIVKKISKKTNFLRRISKDVSVFTRLTIYKSIVAPHFEYCSTLLLYLNNNELQVLQKLQNKAMRVILQCTRYTPINNMLQILNFMNVRQRILLRTLQYVYKIKNFTLPNYLCNKVMYVGDIHDYETRGRNDLYVERHHSLIAGKSLFCKGFKEYNNLPSGIKNSKSFKQFTCSCVTYIRSLPT